MNETGILITVGMLGVTIHSLMKAQSLQKDAEKANLKFSINDYWKRDYLGIIISFLSVFLWLLLAPEVSMKYQWLANWMRVSFGAVSMMGSYIIQVFLSQAKRWIRKEVDHKTDVADGKKKKED